MTTQLTRTSNGSGQALAEADAQRLAAVLDSALSANTRRAYRAAATRCADWLRGRGLELDDAGLAAYVADLADQGRAPATIKLAASAVGARIWKSRRDWPPQTDRPRACATPPSSGSAATAFYGSANSPPSRSRIWRRTRTVPAAGIEGRVSGHSLRVGSAQSLVRAGADLPALMQAGRWKDSATAAGYAAGELASRGAVAEFFYGAGK